MAKGKLALIVSVVFLLVASAPAWAATTITFLAAPQQMFDSIVKAFNTKYADHYKVDLYYATGTNQVIDRALLDKATGSPPDLLYQIYTLDMVIAGLAADLTPYVERDRSWMNDFLPSSLGSFQLNNKLYGLPTGVYATYGVAYNPEVVAQAGLPLPKEGWNWDEFIAYGKKLTLNTSGGSEPDRWGMVFQDDHTWWDGFLLQNGSIGYDWARHEWLPDIEPATKALSYYDSLMNTYNIGSKNLRSNAARAAFAAGRSAMWIDQQSPMGKYRAEYNFDMKATHLPVNTSRQVGLKSWGVFMVDTGNKAKMDATWQFVKFMYDIEQNMDIVKFRGDFPPRKSILQSSLYQSYLKELGIFDLYSNFWMREIERYGISWVFPPARPEFLTAVGNATKKVLNGELSPANAVLQTRETIAPISAEILAKLGK